MRRIGEGVFGLVLVLCFVLGSVGGTLIKERREKADEPDKPLPPLEEIDPAWADKEATELKPETNDVYDLGSADYQWSNFLGDDTNLVNWNTMTGMTPIVEVCGYPYTNLYIYADGVPKGFTVHVIDDAGTNSYVLVGRNLVLTEIKP